MLEELFADWSEEDLLFTLQDANGDLELAIDRISIGQVNQWDEVKTKKSKKEAASVNNNLNKPTISESTIKPKANSIKQRPNSNKKPQSWNNTVKKSMTTDHWSTALTTKSDSWKKVPIKNTPKTWASLLQESSDKAATDEEGTNNNGNNQQRQLLFSNSKEAYNNSNKDNDISLDFHKLNLNEEKQPKITTVNDLFDSIKPKKEEPNTLDYSIYGGFDQQKNSSSMNYYNTPVNNSSNYLFYNQQTLYGNNNAFYPYCLPFNTYQQPSLFSNPSFYSNQYNGNDNIPLLQRGEKQQQRQQQEQQSQNYLNTPMYSYNQQQQYWNQ
ncbi:hypothetical protein G6F62_003780 [Rhizopus arrhizus]|nr:hypothetical protein G6F62_003780 [Rhizopus arrhizus]